MPDREGQHEQRREIFSLPLGDPRFNHQATGKPHQSRAPAVLGQPGVWLKGITIWEKRRNSNCLVSTPAYATGAGMEAPLALRRFQYLAQELLVEVSGEIR